MAKPQNRPTFDGEEVRGKIKVEEKERGRKRKKSKGMKREKARKRKGGKGEKKSTIGNKRGKRIDGRAQRTDKNRTKEK